MSFHAQDPEAPFALRSADSEYGRLFLARLDSSTMSPNYLICL